MRQCTAFFSGAVSIFTCSIKVGASPELNGFRITPRHCAALDLRGYPGHLRGDSISCSSPQNCTLCTLLVGKIFFFALLPSAATILAK